MIGTEHATRLIGKNIELLCFAQYSIYIHFEESIILTVESGLEHVHDGVRHTLQLSSPPTNCSLLVILETKVTSATLDASGGLHLTTSNGDSLRIYKEPQYESYRLSINGEELLP